MTIFKHNIPIMPEWQEKCTFEGCVSLEESDGCLSPWRIPFAEHRLFPFLTEGELPITAACSGVRLTFLTDANQVGLDLAQVDDGMKLDIYVDHAFSETITLTAGNQTVLINLPGTGDRQIEIWLDPRYRFYLHKICLPAGYRMARMPIADRRWIHYGSSISHSMAAATPSQIWTGIVAREHKLHLTNLGFSGHCVLEPMIGRLIRDLPADIITLKLGINTYSGRLSARSFGPNAIGLIKLIREKHPNTPLVVISPIISPPREEVRMTEMSMTLQEMRDNLAEIVQIFQDYGDNNIHYLDGLKLFGPTEINMLPDELHPNAAGQMIMADHFSRELASLLVNPAG